MSQKKKEYISLKEASQISGYSPDYVGQLIRGGKLPGKQVFQQAVWMTTEEDLRSYLENKGTSTNGVAEKSGPAEWAKRAFSKRKSAIEAPRLAIRALYATVVVAVLLFLLLFYVFSSSVEQRLNEQAMQTVEASTTP